MRQSPSAFKVEALFFFSPRIFFFFPLHFRIRIPQNTKIERSTTGALWFSQMRGGSPCAHVTNDKGSGEGPQQCPGSCGKSMQTVPGGWRIDTIDWPPRYLKFNRTPLGDDVLVHLKSPGRISHYQGPDPDLGGNPPGDISLGECPDIRHAYKHVGSYKLLSTKYQHKGVFEFT